MSTWKYIFKERYISRFHYRVLVNIWDIRLMDKKLISNTVMYITNRGGNRAGRAGLGRANTGPGQNRAGPKLARFFRANILTAQPALKTGPVGPNSHFKAKKNSGGPGWAGPYRAAPNLARFFSGQKFNGPARP